MKYPIECTEWVKARNIKRLQNLLYRSGGRFKSNPLKLFNERYFVSLGFISGESYRKTAISMRIFNQSYF